MRDFMMAALPLVVAGIAWLCSSPDWQKRKRSRKRKTAMRPLAIALACILLSNLFNVIRMNMDKK